MWRFESEFALESFLEANLEKLLGLKVLARQHIIEGQICDLLAVTSTKQLAVLELKNVEDRYIIQQLTRYYKHLVKECPFADQIDYSQPVRLIAVAPNFHKHTFIDREYNVLKIELFRFSIQEELERDVLTISLLDLDSDNLCQIDILPDTKNKLYKFNEQEPPKRIPPPPKSLKGLTDKLSETEQAYIFALRQQILEFDDLIREVGRTTRTQYGTAKGTKEIYKTKTVAEFFPAPTFKQIQLRLMLPYPKKQSGVPSRHLSERVKGYAFAVIPLLELHVPEKKEIHFFLDPKSKVGTFGYSYDFQLYSRICEIFLGFSPELQTTEDFVNLALRLWREDGAF